MQVDIGFGDAVFPAPEVVRYPTLLGMTAPEIRAYPKETVIAEKLQAMVPLAAAIARMKDYADLLMMAEDFDFEGSRIAGAIRSTFERRKTPIPHTTPDGLSDAFAQDPEKRRQWEAFRKRTAFDAGVNLDAVVKHIRPFLLPPMSAVLAELAFSGKWEPGGPWL